ncbi:MAG: transglycosylase SLT domain-containing protein [Rickettsiales bacterium]|nr:transglycosylase SLT domain-containing protein [Rickettsiales bacterium]
MVLGVLASTALGENSIFIRKHVREDVKKYLMTANDENVFRQIKKKIISKNWKSAEMLLKNIKSESYRRAIETYLQLKRFKTVFSVPEKEASKLVEFNSKNNFLGEFELINRRIEFYYLNNTLRFSEVARYFNRFQTRDINVLIKLLRDEGTSLEKMKDVEPKKLTILRENLIRKIHNVWIAGNFSVDDQEIFFSNFAHRLGEKDIVSRAEMLVFKWQLGCLDRLIPMISSGEYRVLFESIVKLKNYPESLEEVLKDIPKNLLENEALLYARAKYFESNGVSENTLEVIRKLGKNPKYERFWYDIFVDCGRELIRAKRYQEAYDVVSGYRSLSAGDYTNRIWLSGWLALRFLKKYDLAEKHFQDLYRHVIESVNRSRAAYWLGRTAEEKNEIENAQSWYRAASRYPLTFYGQMAIHRINALLSEDTRLKEPKIPLPDTPKITQKDILSLEKNWIVKYALLCYRYEGKKDEAISIFTKLIASILKTEGEIGELIGLIDSLGDDQLTFKMSMEASRRMVFFMDNLYPVIRLAEKSNPNRAMVHAMARQESGFVKYVESNRMAKGLMQIIPPTARAICRELNIEYNSYSLKSNVEYNIKIANHYINKLAKQFNDSKVLIVASYNAGPEIVNRWMAESGDPRDKKIEDIIDWIESVTYKETRGYLQRVLEALLIYENIFSEKK